MLKLKLLTTNTLIILGITLGISAMPVNAEPTKGEQHRDRITEPTEPTRGEQHRDKITESIRGEQQSGSPRDKEDVWN